MLRLALGFATERGVPAARFRRDGRIGVAPNSAVSLGFRTRADRVTNQVALDGGRLRASRQTDAGWEVSGVEEDNQFLFDKQRGILYTYREDNYQCADGTSQNGDVLMGIYAQGNPGGRPVGSGWFVVAVKAGQGGEKKGGLFGCRFDTTGKPTTCGTARVKEESGELELVVKK